MNVNENKTDSVASATPKPVFTRMVMLFGAAIGCLLVGIVVARVTGDMILLGMSAILGATFIAKGFLLKQKINAGQIYSVSGVCVSITPKILGRYRRIELVNTDTGDDVSFILPKKVVFKVGHIYSCYFDNLISNRPLNMHNPKGGFIYADVDLPTNGFLGFDDFGVYQEKPAAAAIVATTDNSNLPIAEDNTDQKNKEEQKCQNKTQE